MRDREQFQKNRNRDKRKRQKDKDTSFIVPQAWGKRARWERRGLFGPDTHTPHTGPAWSQLGQSYREPPPRYRPAGRRAAFRWER